MMDLRRSPIHMRRLWREIRPTWETRMREPSSSLRRGLVSMGDTRSQDLHQGVEGVVGPVLPEVPLRSLTSIHKGGLLTWCHDVHALCAYYSLAGRRSATLLGIKHQSFQTALCYGMTHVMKKSGPKKSRPDFLETRSHLADLRTINI